ncbi:MAG: type 1 glutamine amidotransferase [Pseudomonadota bacterium]
MPRVLLLDYSTDRTEGPLTARWLPQGTPLVTWAQLDGGPLPPLGGVSHVIHTGSAHSINDDPPFVAGAMALVREAVARGIPQLGICYGHQLLCRALGGRAAVRRCPTGLQAGFLPARFSAEGQAVFGVAPEAVVWQYHFDEVVALPSGAAILAADDHSAVQAFEEPNRRLLGTQFHPEVDAVAGRRIFRAEARELAGHGLDAEKLAQGGPTELDCGALFARWLTR